MKHAIGYLTIFVSGFAACALILRASQRPSDAGLPSGRGPLSQALAASGLGKGALSSGLPSVADAAARLAPSVVNIEVAGTRAVRHPSLFGSRVEDQAFEGMGSGIVLSADGFVLTNNHVVAEVAGQPGGTIAVKLSDGRPFSAIVIGRDPASDLAVIKLLGASGLTAAQLGDSDRVRVGDWAIAVGNPLGFSSTVTLGIVSALNRDYLRRDATALDRVIQTDAPINPGSSGGALADTDGRVIGVNTAIASSTGASVGIGFAIPINAARQIASQLIARGKVARPYLGVTYLPVKDVDPKTIPGIVVPSDSFGVLIQRSDAAEGVAANSPAAKAGLQERDIIRAMDGEPLRTENSLRERIATHKVGETVQLTVQRDNQNREFTVVLEEMPENYGR